MTLLPWDSGDFFFSGAERNCCCYPPLTLGGSSLKPFCFLWKLLSLTGKGTTNVEETMVYCTQEQQIVLSKKIKSCRNLLAFI